MHLDTFASEWAGLTLASCTCIIALASESTIGQSPSYAVHAGAQVQAAKLQLRRTQCYAAEVRKSVHVKSLICLAHGALEEISLAIGTGIACL